MTDGPASDALVIFGITGDLARHKTFLALYQLERRMLLEVPVIGSGRTEWTDADLRAHARAAIEEHGPPDHEALGRFLTRLSYVGGDTNDPTTFDRVREALNGLAMMGVVEIRNGRPRLRLHNATDHLADLQTVDSRAKDESRRKSGAL